MKVSSSGYVPNSMDANASLADAAAVVFNLKKKKVKLKRSSIKDIARGMAEIAYSIGDTNDPEEYANEIYEDVLAGLSLAEKNRAMRTR
jgi:hypothetical protein